MYQRQQATTNKKLGQVDSKSAYFTHIEPPPGPAQMNYQYNNGYAGRYGGDASPSPSPTSSFSKPGNGYGAPLPTPPPPPQYYTEQVGELTKPSRHRPGRHNAKEGSGCLSCFGATLLLLVWTAALAGGGYYWLKEFQLPEVQNEVEHWKRKFETMEELNAELERVQNQRYDDNKLRQEMEKQADEFQMQFKAVENSLKMAQSQRLEAQNRAQQLQRELQEAQHQRNAESEYVQQLRHELHEAQRDLQEAQHHVQAEAEHSQELQQHVHVLAEHVERLQRDLQEAQQMHAESSSQNGKDQVVPLQQAIQEQSRQLVVQKYGQGPYRVEFEVHFPHDNHAWFFVVETAPLEHMPHSIGIFLDQVQAGLYNQGGFAFHHNGHHITYGSPYPNFLSHPDGVDNHDEAEEILKRRYFDRGLGQLLFAEYSPEFPHLEYTLAFAGRPGGPGMYVNTINNAALHGPGGYSDDGMGDPCFAKVISGLDVIERMHHASGDDLQDGDWREMSQGAIAVVSAHIL